MGVTGEPCQIRGGRRGPALVSGVSPRRSGYPSDETLPRTLARGRRKVCQNRGSNGVPTPKFCGTGQSGALWSNYLASLIELSGVDDRLPPCCRSSRACKAAERTLPEPRLPQDRDQTAPHNSTIYIGRGRTGRAAGRRLVRCRGGNPGPVALTTASRRRGYRFRASPRGSG